MCREGAIGWGREMRRASEERRRVLGWLVGWAGGVDSHPWVGVGKVGKTRFYIL